MKIYVQSFGRSGSNNFVLELSRKLNLNLYNDIHFDKFIEQNIFQKKNIIVKSVHYDKDSKELIKIIDSNFDYKFFLERKNYREMAISNLSAEITDEWHSNRKYIINDISEKIIKERIKLFDRHINYFKKNINKNEWIFISYENLYNENKDVRIKEINKLKLPIPKKQIIELSESFKPKKYGGKKISYLDFINRKIDKNKII